MRFFSILAFFIGVPLASGTFSPVREADYWQATGIDLNFARRFISNDFCNQASRNLESCQRAVESLINNLGLANDPLFKTGKFDFDAILTTVDSRSWSQPKEMIYARLINEQLHFFDAHAQMLPLQYYQTAIGQPSREHLGIGIETELTAAGVFIRRVQPFSPASHAGIRVNDRIVRVQYEEVLPGLKAHKALALLNVRRDQDIHLALERDGQRLNVKINTAPLLSRDLDFEESMMGPGRGLVLSVHRFSDGMCSEFEAAIKQAKGISWVMIDMRDNPGGLLAEALCMASLFVGSKAHIERKVVSQSIPREFGLRLKSSKTEEVMDEPPQSAVFPALPVILLVSAKTKSAAEVLSAILQDQKRAWIVGERTYGKGTTQIVSEVPFNKNLRVTYTFTRYQRPDGSTFQLAGVSPNFEEPFKFGASAEERTFYREGDVERNALEQGTSVPWKEIRSKEVKRLRSCVANQNLDRKLATSFKMVDHQKAYALALLHCL